ncbi:MAG: DUF3078 domain-containing protein [Ignavibacteria bacterium]|nr:DUF3078 domain-containing protein [Ignavibacteria bacterium]
MKKISITVSLFFLLSASLSAQQDTIIFYKWVPKVVAGLNLSQISLSNWTQGGEDAISWTFLSNGSLSYRTELWHFKNDLKLAYGRTKLGSANFRTTDNELYLESVISRDIGWVVDSYFSNTVRTALAAGFNYDTNPPTEIANFFDPGYLTQSLGFIYDKTPGFSTRLGFAVQEVITNEFTFYSDDTSTTEIEKIKVETGIESVTTAEYTVMENILLKSKLRLFSRFESFDVWDVRWDNTIAAQVNEYVNVSFVFLLIYEEAQIRKTQIKEALQLGITYTIL